MDPRAVEKRLWFRRVLEFTLPAALVWGCTAEPSSAPGVARLLSTPYSASEQPKPSFNLEVLLRPPAGGDGFGHVKFRQPNDPETRVNLDVWVRDLAPNTHYQLQRATDGNLNDDCAGTNWLTLGSPPVAIVDIVTDEKGTGTVELFRILSGPGSAFDIHFRVVRAGTTTVVLTSECYQFFVR